MKVKTTIITGFLGAGKTTFINKLLKNNQGIKFALVENEFGDVAIDTKLIKGVDAGKMFELKNGCICCTITNEYELILLELADRFPDVEHLIIETTGVADPSPVIKPFFNNKDIRNRFEYQATICLVDAVNFNNQPGQEISLKQIAVADYIVINKTDLVAEKDKNKLKHILESVNPQSDIKFAKHGVCNEFDLANSSNDNKIIFLPQTSKNHHAGLTSKTITITEPLEKEVFLEKLSYMLDIYKKQIYRIKGVVYFNNEPFEYILQGVGPWFELTEGGFAEEKQSNIVFIGKLDDLDLYQCLV